LWVEVQFLGLSEFSKVFSDHKLEKLSTEKTERFQKKGFKQLEISLRNK